MPTLYFYGVVVAAAALVLHRVLHRREKPKIRMRASSLGTTSFLCGNLFEEFGMTNIMNIVVRYNENSGPTMEGLQEVFLQKITRHLRFNSVPVQAERGGEILWVPCKIEPHRHFFQHPPIVAGRDKKSMHDIINDMLNTDLNDKTIPWWEIHYFEEKEGGDVKATVVMRIHHALGDGASLVEMFSEVILDEHGVPLNKLLPEDVFSRQHVRQQKKLWYMYPYYLFDLLRHAAAVALAAFGKFDTPTPFFDHRARKKSLGNSRWMVVFLPSVPLDLLKGVRDAIQKKTGIRATINDMVFALYAGAVRRYVAHCGVDPNVLYARCLAGFAFPEKVCEKTRYATLLRIYWTYMCNRFPVDAPNAVDRILRAHESWEECKTSMKLPAALLMHHVAGLQSPQAQRDAVLGLNLRVTTDFSNVAGPNIHIHFGKGKVKQVYMLFPNIHPQTGFFSHNGNLDGCITLEDAPETRESMQALLPRFYMEEVKEAQTMCGL